MIFVHEMSISAKHFHLQILVIKSFVKPKSDAEKKKPKGGGGVYYEKRST